MGTRKVRKALKEVAKNHGISVAEVRREIELATTSAQANPDPQVQAKLTAVPKKGEIPTPEELIAHIARMVDDKIN